MEPNWGFSIRRWAFVLYTAGSLFLMLDVLVNLASRTVVRCHRRMARAATFPLRRRTIARRVFRLVCRRYLDEPDAI